MLPVFIIENFPVLGKIAIALLTSICDNDLVYS